MAYVGFIAVVLTWLYVIYSVMKINVDIDEMRHTMLDVLAKEEQEIGRCLQGWKNTIEKFDGSVKATNKILGALKQKQEWILCNERLPEIKLYRIEHCEGEDDCDPEERSIYEGCRSFDYEVYRSDEVLIAHYDLEKRLICVDKAILEVVKYPHDDESKDCEDEITWLDKEDGYTGSVHFVNVIAWSRREEQ